MKAILDAIAANDLSTAQSLLHELFFDIANGKSLPSVETGTYICVHDGKSEDGYDILANGITTQFIWYKFSSLTGRFEQWLEWTA